MHCSVKPHNKLVYSDRVSLIRPSKTDARFTCLALGRYKGFFYVCISNLGGEKYVGKLSKA